MTFETPNIRLIEQFAVRSNRDTFDDDDPRDVCTCKRCGFVMNDISPSSYLQTVTPYPYYTHT